MREYAVDGLCGFSDPRLVEPLLALMKDERFRYTVLEMAPCKDPRFLEPLLADVRDPSWRSPRATGSRARHAAGDRRAVGPAS